MILILMIISILVCLDSQAQASRAEHMRKVRPPMPTRTLTPTRIGSCWPGILDFRDPVLARWVGAVRDMEKDLLQGSC